MFSNGGVAWSAVWGVNGPGSGPPGSSGDIFNTTCGSGRSNTPLNSSDQRHGALLQPYLYIYILLNQFDIYIWWAGDIYGVLGFYIGGAAGWFRADGTTRPSTLFHKESILYKESIWRRRGFFSLLLGWAVFFCWFIWDQRPSNLFPDYRSVPCPVSGEERRLHRFHRLLPESRGRNAAWSAKPFQ